MGRYLASLVLVLAFASSVSYATALFRFSTMYGDHMVLQRAPKHATVWGFGEPHSNVVVTVDGHAVGTTVDTDGKWLAILPAMAPGGPHTITAKSASQTIALNDVLFGDVWVCGGQSNMEFTVSSGNNATAEAADASRYPNIRFNTVRQLNTSTPLDEVASWWIQWSVSSPATVGGPQWGYFSAVCWFYAKNIYDKYQIPLGMISSNYGGTAVEWWSSADALAACPKAAVEVADEANPLTVGISNSQLWNAMIVPLLRTTIYGVIWYQGEANAGSKDYYCRFPAMVDDWRVKWHKYTQGQTDEQFYFGFVQLSTWNGGMGVADVRWQQTANYGHVPNPRQVNYFMAEAMDLGSPAPAHDIHPANKQDVGYRLALAGRAIAYREQGVYWTGPLIQSAKVAALTNGVVTVNVVFINVGASGLQLRAQYNNTGFELQDKLTKQWSIATAKLTARDTIAVSATLSNPASSIRYAWRDVPCEQFQCLIYSATESIPAPPFIQVLA